MEEGEALQAYRSADHRGQERGAQRRRAPAVPAQGGDDDQVVVLWDRAGLPLIGHTDRVTALAYRPGGGQLASGGDNLIVRRPVDPEEAADRLDERVGLG